MKQNNNWCREIIKNTISLFKPGNNFFNKDYCDINNRYFLLYFYWKKIGLDKKVCDNCQKLWQAEKDKLEKEDEEWEKEQEEELKNRKCASCQKEITSWRYKKMSEALSEEVNDEDSNWENKGVLGRYACKNHDNYYCQDENCAGRQRAFCSLKCLKESENKEDEQYWLQKSSVGELYEEIERRKSFHKKIVEQCCSCHKEAADWIEMDLDMIECRKCYEANNEWVAKIMSKEGEKKEKIKCSGCGKTKLLGYRENYLKVYCVDCAPSHKKWKSKHFWFCADDCPQGEK